MAKQLQKNMVFCGKIIQVSVEHVCLPNGTSLDMELVHHPGGAAVVALDIDNNVCLLRQYRYAFKDWIWEIPAGKLDNKEQPLSSAQRELQEEAGIAANNWHSLGDMISSPGVFTEKVYLYLASDLVPAKAAVEEHEVFEVHWIALEQAVDWAHTGMIADAKSVIALCRTEYYLNNLHK